MEELQKSIQSWGKDILDYSPKLILGVIVLVIGLRLVAKLMKIISVKLDNSSLSPEILPFLLSVIGITLKMTVILIAASIIGVQTASFMTIIAALTFAIGMSLQGSLSNIASGILILIFKPYKNGDYISIGDHKGVVKEVQIINTVIRSLENENIIIPNSNAISDVIVNSSGEDGMVRIEFDIHMPYNENFDKVKTIVLDALHNIKYVLADPAPLVGIKTFESHSIIVTVRPYCRVQDYEYAYYMSTEAVKNALGQNNIKMSYSEGIELGDISA